MPIDRLKHTFATVWDRAASAWPGPPWLTVIYYHAVPRELLKGFELQMSYLRRHANLVHAHHRGPLDPTRPNVAVTFDDAFRSVVDNALPVLEQHRIPVTIFAPTGWAGRAPGWARHGKWDDGEVVAGIPDLAERVSDLVSIGSHSVDHVHLSRLPRAEISDQLRRSRDVLEGACKRRVDTLSFPYGDYSPLVLELAWEAGYRTVFSDQPRGAREGDQGLLRGRTAVSAADGMQLFALKSRGAFAWMPAASRVKAILSGRWRALSPGWRWQDEST